jgi:hypothetical protein
MPYFSGIGLFFRYMAALTKAFTAATVASFFHPSDRLKLLGSAIITVIELAAPPIAALNSPFNQCIVSLP